MALVQADARDGIWLDTPAGRKKTYLFLWLDDFSRKILFGKYYFDEKLPAMIDSFRYCLLRYGIPVRVYVDGGKATLIGFSHEDGHEPYALSGRRGRRAGVCSRRLTQT